MRTGGPQGELIQRVMILEIDQPMLTSGEPRKSIVLKPSELKGDSRGLTRVPDEHKLHLQLVGGCVFTKSLVAMISRAALLTTKREFCLLRGFVLFALMLGCIDAGLSDARPLDIRVITKLPLSNSWYGGSAFKNGYLYLGTGGLTVVDIRDANAPAIISSIPGEMHANDLAIDGDTLCHANGYQLAIYDVSNPSTPVLTGVITNFTPTKIAFSTRCLVAEDSTGITTIAVTNRHNPSILGRYTASMGPDPLLTAGNVAYFVDAAGAVAVLDLTQPETPTLLTTIPGTQLSQLLAVSGSALYFRSLPALPPWQSLEFEVSDISNPNSPETPQPAFLAPDQGLVQTITPSEGGSVLACSGSDYFSVFTKDGGADLTFAGALGFWPTTVMDGPRNGFRIVGVTGRYAILDIAHFRPENTEELWLLDISTPSTYLPVNEFQSACIMGLHDRNAYLNTLQPAPGQNANGYPSAAFPYLQSIGLTNAVLPFVAPTSKTPMPNYGQNGVNAFALSQDTGVLLYGGTSIILYDLSRSQVPKYVSSMSLNGQYGQSAGGATFAVNSTDVFLGTYGKPSIVRIKIADPRHPTLVNSLSLRDFTTGQPWIHAIASYQSTLFVAYENSLASLDIGGSTNLAFAGSIPAQSPIVSLVAAGGFLGALGTPADGISFYNIADPRHPALVAENHNNCIYISATVAGHCLYVSKMGYGIDIFDLSTLPVVTRVAGNSQVPVATMFSNDSFIVVGSARPGYFLNGVSHILPLFEQMPVYTPYSQNSGHDGFQFNLKGIPGTTARVQRSNSLGDWTDWTSVSLGTNTISVLDADTTVTNRFYRVVAP